VNAGFGNVPHNPNVYDGTAFGNGPGADSVSIKSKLVNLISATRTLMRCKQVSLVFRTSLIPQYR
jgi:hypothetical protein